MEHVLFLDDDGIRTGKFLRRIPSALTFEKVPEILAELQTKARNATKIKFLFLDHDLNGEVFVDSSREDCGMEVVRFLCKNSSAYKNLIGTVIVHSHNDVASKLMVETLREKGFNVGAIPFNRLLAVIDQWNKTQPPAK